MFTVLGTVLACFTIGADSISIGHPSFVSEWLPLQAQSATLAFREIEHGLGEIPGWVEVQVKSTENPNMDFIFHGIGNGERDDDIAMPYGGVVYIYNAVAVRLFAPNRSNGNSIGAAIYTGTDPNWKGVNTQTSNSVEVRVRCWRAMLLPVPHFHQSEIPVAAGSATLSETYQELSHDLGAYPQLVKVRVHLTDGPDAGWVSDGQGASSMALGTMRRHSKTGGLKYCYGNDTVRVWVSSEAAPCNQLFARNDGWGIAPQTGGVSTTGNLEVFVWGTMGGNSVGQQTVAVGPAVVDEQLQIPLDIQASYTDGIFMSVTAEAVDGPNQGFRFPGVGGAFSNTVNLDATCSYGGLVYAYNQTTLRLWRPDNSMGGVVCLAAGLGQGHNVQASQSAVVVITTWVLKEATHNYYVPPVIGCSHFQLYKDGYDVNDSFMALIQDITTVERCHKECRKLGGCRYFTLGQSQCKLLATVNVSEAVERACYQIWRAAGAS